LSQDRNNDEEKAIHYESGVPIFGRPPKDQDAEQRAERKAARTYENRQISIQRNIFLTQIGLVAFGLIGAGVGLWQANISQQSADTSDKAVLLAQKTDRENRKSGEEQARLAAKSLKTTIGDFRKDQRAWVGFSNFTIEPDTTGMIPGRTIAQSAFAIILNTGKTPALNVKAVEGMFFRSNAETLTAEDAREMESAVENYGKAMRDGSFPRLGFVQTKLYSFGSIAPETSSKQVAGASLSGGSPPNEIVVFGRLTYRDVYGYPHATYFCAYRGQSPTLPASRLSFCPVFNDMQ
jgi:hypothetical protein